MNSPANVELLLEHPTFRLILDAVARHFRVPRRKLLARERTEPLSTARFAAAHLVRKNLGHDHSFEAIARAFNRGSQNWAIKAHQTTQARLALEPRTARLVLAADAEVSATRGPLCRTFPQ